MLIAYADFGLPRQIATQICDNKILSHDVLVTPEVLTGDPIISPRALARRLIMVEG